MTLQELGTFNLKSVYNTFLVAEGVIPVDQLISITRIQLYGEDYVALYSTFCKIADSTNKLLMLVHLRAGNKCQQFFEIPFNPIRIFTNGMDMLYLYGQGPGASQLGWVSMDGLLKAPPELQSPADSCWAVQNNIDVQYQMDNSIDLVVRSQTNCVMESILITYKDYFSEKPFVYDKGAQKYSVMREIDFKQISWELVLKNVPGVRSGLLTSNFVQVQSDNIESCYTQAGLIKTSLQNNLLQLALDFSFQTHCAVDQPQITVSFMREIYSYKKQMVPIENTNPLKGATYEVFFPGKLFKGINDKVTFSF